MTTPAYALPKRRRIFLMRHGDVTYFDATGRAIDPVKVPLNERGRDEATAAGREFKAQQIRFDKVIASGLPRTLETAQRVLAETGQQIDIDVWPEWKEIRGGRLSNLPPKDFERAFLSVFDGIVPETTAFLGGETIGELLDRVLPPLQRLRDDTTWDTALLVLHGGVNRALLSHAITGGERMFFGHLSQTTGCINALDVGDKPGDWVIRALNHSPPSPLHASVRNTTMELLYEQFVRFTSVLK
ncbi:histidine phosphatase family protein [Caballeronia sp. DA-9]|uniref:histidine phosphatase family protein n=1 Tax=Caballeronia sp. DA-9 TaxID=3436237 RepID=UPI003F663915